jgi:hypothetical protein
LHFGVEFAHEFNQSQPCENFYILLSAGRPIPYTLTKAWNPVHRAGHQSSRCYRYVRIGTYWSGYTCTNFTDPAPWSKNTEKYFTVRYTELQIKHVNEEPFWSFFCCPVSHHTCVSDERRNFEWSGSEKFVCRSESKWYAFGFCLNFLCVN